MTSPAVPIATSALRGAPPPIAWRIWPLSDGGIQMWLFLGIMAAVGGTVGSVTTSGGWAAAAMACVGAAAWRFFVPVAFELSALGLSQQVFGWRRRIPWTSIEHVEIGREGLILSLEGVPLAALRGLYIPWGTHREEVLAQVAYYVPGNRLGNSMRVRLATDSVSPTAATADSATAKPAGGHQ